MQFLTLLPIPAKWQWPQVPWCLELSSRFQQVDWC